MLGEERVLELNAEGLLADVVGFETDEVALTTSGTSVVTYRGKRFIDFTGGIAVHACGHAHPEIVAAIQKQAAKVVHVSDIMRHAPQLELGSWLRTLFTQAAPGSPWTFLFKNSGSESVDAAAKLALKVTGRGKLAAFEGAFHGRTLFASALSRSNAKHWTAYEPFLAPLRANILHTPPLRRDNNGVAALEKMLERNGQDIAAVFFEAQQGEGGYIPMPATAAKRLRELTREHGILLVADEIQSGCGRTGRWFGFEHLGIVPDIVVFGKAIGGGLPLAGVAAPSEIMAKWEPGEHGTTFGGNPVACAAGLAALKIIERDRLVERAASVGAKIKERLACMIGSHGVVDVRGNGLMIGIELRGRSGKPDYALCDRIKLRARERGLLLLTCGAKLGSPLVDNSTLRLIPPLNVPEETIIDALEILEAAIRAGSNIKAA